MEPRDEPAGPLSSSPALPASLREALNAPRVERKDWQHGLAPHFIGLFLWVVFFDRLAPATLAVGGLGWSALGALAGGLLSFLLLYQAPALWGQRTGRGLEVLGSGTFGASGSVWITGVLIGLAEVVWFAVATYYATDLTLQGLVSCHLIEPRALRPILLGHWTFQGPLFLATSLAWSFAAALTGHYLIRIISALMNIYPIFPALMLGTVVVLTLTGVSSFQPLAAVAAPAAGGWNGNRNGPHAFLMMIQLVMGFFAMAGVMSADWGAASRTPRDVTLGGLVGVVFSSTIVATLALLSVAGAAGRMPAPTVPPNAGDLTFHASVSQAIGGTLGGVVLLIFGLGSLAPATYSAYVFGRRFAAVRPRFSALRWSLIGTVAAWPFVATGAAGRIETVFGLMGAVFAPIAGALAADATRRAHSGTWRGPRPGTNMAGLLAWALGLAVGLVPTIAASWGFEPGTRFQPASLFAFLTAYIAFKALAALGAEPPAVKPE